MKKLLLIGLIIVSGWNYAQTVKEGTVTLERPVEMLAAGYGFAFKNTLNDYNTFFVKVLAKVRQVEVIKQGAEAKVHSSNVIFPISEIRLGYDSYPLVIREFDSRNVKADVYQPAVIRLGEVVKAKPVGELTLKFKMLKEGIKVAEGTLVLNKKKYIIRILSLEVNDDFKRWAPELFD